MNAPKKDQEAKEYLTHLNFILEHSDTQLPSRTTEDGEYYVCKSAIKEFVNIEIIFLENNSIKTNPARYHIVLDAQGNFKSKMKSSQNAYPEICSDQQALQIVEDAVNAFADLFNIKVVTAGTESNTSQSLIDSGRADTKKKLLN